MISSSIMLQVLLTDAYFIICAGKPELEIEGWASHSGSKNTTVSVLMSTPSLAIISNTAAATYSLKG